MSYPLKKGKIYNNQQWKRVQQLLKDRKQGKYPALDKKIKKEEKINETRKGNYQQLQKHSAS